MTKKYLLTVLHQTQKMQNAKRFSGVVKALCFTLMLKDGRSDADTEGQHGAIGAEPWRWLNLSWRYVMTTALDWRLMVWWSKRCRTWWTYASSGWFNTASFTSRCDHFTCEQRLRNSTWPLMPMYLNSPVLILSSVQLLAFPARFVLVIHRLQPCWRFSFDTVSLVNWYCPTST